MNSPPAPDDRPTVWQQARAEREAEGRRPSVKRLILNMITAGLVVAVAAFFAAPLVAFYGVRAAAGAGDVQGLAQLIDYDAVRASLRPQLASRPAPQTPPPSILQDPLGAIRRQFDQAVQPAEPAGPDVEAYLAPAALEALSLGHGRASPRFGLAGAAPAPETRRSRPRPVYWSVNRARLAVRDPQAATETVFTFERRGPFEWRLVHIGLPDRAAAAVSG